MGFSAILVQNQTCSTDDITCKQWHLSLISESCGLQVFAFASNSAAGSIRICSGLVPVILIHAVCTGTCLFKPTNSSALHNCPINWLITQPFSGDRHLNGPVPVPCPTCVDTLSAMTLTKQVVSVCLRDKGGSCMNQMCFVPDVTNQEIASPGCAAPVWRPARC